MVRSGVYAHAYVEEPNLVYVSPGVWVVEDYHEPVFWYGDHYWVHRHGYWYRSTVYTGGWVRVHAVPGHVRGIHNPHRYVRYRAPRGVRTRPAPGVRDHRAPPPRGRDHRTYQPRSNERVPASRGAPPARGSRPGVNRTYQGGSRKNAPPPHRSPSKSKPKPETKSKSKSKSRDHR